MPKKGGKKKGPPETPEERALREETERLKAEEDRRRKEEAMRTKLGEDMEQEAKFAKLNLAKIQNQWRKLMRLAKVESLRKDLEIMSQNHEREVDMKDAIIQMLDRDLDEAEEQYQTALRSHLQNVDALIDLYNSKVRQLESEFEAEIRQMQDDFQTERTEIVTKHAAARGELIEIIELVEAQFKESEAEAMQDFDSYCEELKNKNLEDRNVLKLMLEAQIEQLENHFANAAETYDQTTRQRTQQFRNLTAKDRNSAHTIETQLKRLQRLQDTLAHWRMKIASNVKECEERNRLMREEKEQISRHFQELKARMNKMRDEQGARLRDLGIQSRKCVTTLEAQKTRAETILRYAELNRKMETDREKVLPFHPFTVSDEDNSVPDDLTVEASALSSYALGNDGKPVEEWNYLDVFFKRYNKVLLDKYAISKEESRLQQENSDLRNILKQYLDGISVNADVINEPNPLFVLNNRTNIQHAPVISDAHITIQSANVVVNQHAMMAGH
jgi:dynein regulatory complex subunit 2